MRTKKTWSFCFAGLLMTAACAHAPRPAQCLPDAQYPGLTVASDSTGWVSRVEVDLSALPEAHLVLRVDVLGEGGEVTIDGAKAVPSDRAEAIRAYAKETWTFSEKLNGQSVWFVVPVATNDAGETNIDGAFVIARALCRERIEYPSTANALGIGAKVRLKPYIRNDGSVSIGELSENSHSTLNASFVQSVNAGLRNWRYNPSYAGLPLRTIRFDFRK